MSDDRSAQGDQIHVDEVIVVNEPRDVGIRQTCLTTAIAALSIWTALEFLRPIARAAVIAIAQ